MLPERDWTSGGMPQEKYGKVSCRNCRQICPRNRIRSASQIQMDACIESLDIDEVETKLYHISLTASLSRSVSQNPLI